MPPPPRNSLGYLPALDGLRALAVGAVLAYHLGFSRTPGGYIGVEVFFVLSGWLVCALLASEHEANGSIDLRAFWWRRARRLLPAVTLVIGSTLCVAALAHYARLGSLRLDAASAMAYVFNWRLIIGKQSYFEAAAGPSPLQHLWSLSIEEQFYLLLPLALGGVLAIRRSPAAAAPVVLAAAAAFTAWRMVLLSPTVDPSRVYFGTDTRAAGLLAGVALGLVWVPTRLRSVPGRWAPPLFDVVGLAALAVIGWYAVGVSERDPDALGWSLTAVQVASLVVIAVIVHPVRGLLATALSTRPLRWVGSRSYGIYLWHWPLIVAFARAPGEQPESPARTAALVAATLLLAAVSYRVVEEPIRRRGLRNVLRAIHGRVGRLAAGRPIAAGTIIVVILTGLAGGSVLGYKATLAPTTDVIDAGPLDVASARAGAGVTVEATQPTVATPVEPAPPLGAAGVAAGVLPAPVAPPPPADLPPPPPPAPVFPPTTGIGDSIMVGAAPAISARIGPDLIIDAAISRQGVDAPEDVQRLADENLLGHVVIFHLGANGPYPASTMDEVMQICGPNRLVILVNAYVPRRWEAEVNSTLADTAARHPNAVLVDWNGVAASDPGMLRDDGYHLTGPGAERYADVLATTILDETARRQALATRQPMMTYRGRR